MTVPTGTGSFTVDVVIGLAQHLTDAGHGLYKPTGAYAKGQWGITFYSVPQGPDDVITLTPYPGSDDVRTDTSVLNVQVRCRGPAGTPVAAQAKDDAIFEYLQAAEHVHLGPAIADSIARLSSLPMGADGLGRWEIASNYALTLTRPTLWRTP